MNTQAALVLIVDDEVQNRRLLEALLRPEGYRTACASNGEEALAMVASSPPDIILLDVMMPGMDGYQVVRALKGDPQTSNIPIIMVTAHIDRSARLTGLAAGAEEFLTKPIDRAELWLRVRNLLRLKTFGDFLQGAGSTLQVATVGMDDPGSSDSRFRGFVDASPLLAWVSDAAGNFLYTNQAWNQVLGIDARDEAERRGEGNAAMGLLEKLNARSQDSSVDADAIQHPTWIPEPDGRFRCWTSVKFPIRDASGTMLTGGVGIDITLQKTAEMEVLNLNANLEQRVMDRTTVLDIARIGAERASAEKSECLAALAEALALALASLDTVLAELGGSVLDEPQRAGLASAAALAADLRVTLGDVRSHCRVAEPEDRLVR